MLEENDGRKGAGDYGLVINVHLNGDEVVASAFEKHRRLAEKLREAKVLGGEIDEGVVHSRGGCLTP